MHAILIDIQRAGAHDGPGLRTVFFFKGCPLRCKWCHNPEAQDARPQLSFHRESCTDCGRCAAVCPVQAHTVIGEQHQHAVSFDRCIRCGRCAGVCPSRALKLIGASYTPEELLKIARRDLPFYEQSGGGVTLSGGEVLLWADFAAEFLARCQAEGIHTCVETSGFGTTDAMEKLLPDTDLFYFDWKISSEEKAMEYLGGSLAPIKRNLRLLGQAQKNIVLRCPIIPGVNDDDEHFETILHLLTELPAIQKAQLLPYHDFGIGKAGNIGTAQTAFPVPTQTEIDRWLAWFGEHAEARAKIEID